jgi:hypothetical protein
MPTGIVISHEQSEPLFEQHFEGLGDYQAAVGGFVEPIHLDTPKLTLLVNEEGKLQELPHNRRATALWWLLEPRAFETDEIVGDVVLLGDMSTDLIKSVPQDLASLILRTESYRSEIRLADRLGWHRTGAEFADYFDAAMNALLHYRSDDAVTHARVVGQARAKWRPNA